MKIKTTAPLAGLGDVPESRSTDRQVIMQKRHTCYHAIETSCISNDKKQAGVEDDTMAVITAYLP